jgi:hypothetical protein
MWCQSGLLACFVFDAEWFLALFDIYQVEHTKRLMVVEFSDISQLVIKDDIYVCIWRDGRCYVYNFDRGCGVPVS